MHLAAPIRRRRAGRDPRGRSSRAVRKRSRGCSQFCGEFQDVGDAAWKFGAIGGEVQEQLFVGGSDAAKRSSGGCMADKETWIVIDDVENLADDFRRGLTGQKGCVSLDCGRSMK